MMTSEEADRLRWARLGLKPEVESRFELRFGSVRERARRELRKSDVKRVQSTSRVRKARRIVAMSYP